MLSDLPAAGLLAGGPVTAGAAPARGRTRAAAHRADRPARRTGRDVIMHGMYTGPGPGGRADMPRTGVCHPIPTVPSDIWPIHVGRLRATVRQTVGVRVQPRAKASMWAEESVRAGYGSATRAAASAASYMGVPIRSMPAYFVIALTATQPGPSTP